MHVLTIPDEEIVETPEKRRVEIINVTTQYMRDLVETSQRPLPFGPNRIITDYDIRAKFLLYQHSSLDIARVLKPDFMHIYYENIFAKSFVKVFVGRNFKRVDANIMTARRERLFKHLDKIGAFEERKNTMKLFSAESLNKPIKAADIRTIAPIFFCLFDFVYHAGDEAAALQSYADFAGTVLSQQRRNRQAGNTDVVVVPSVPEIVAPGDDEDPGTLSASDLNDDFRKLVYMMVDSFKHYPALMFHYSSFDWLTRRA